MGLSAFGLSDSSRQKLGADPEDEQPIYFRVAYAFALR